MAEPMDDTSPQQSKYVSTKAVYLTGQQSQAPMKRVYSFLENLATNTKVSRNKSFLELARKKSALSKHIQNRRKLKERMRKLATDLETIEAQIELVKKDIESLQKMVDEGADDHESDE